METTVKVYELLWRNKWLTSEAKSFDEMISMLRVAADELEAMQRDGVQLDLERGGMEDDYASLTTTDHVIAEKYGFNPEWEDEEDPEETSEDL